MNILVINCGSSSLKFQLIDSESEKVLAKGLCERIGMEGSLLTFSVPGREKKVIESPMPNHTQAVQLVMNTLMDKETGVIKGPEEIGAVCHLVVHGGESFTAPTLITPQVLKVIEECSDLAPLHNPSNLVGIRACQELMPGTPMVAVFDTAFHQTMPVKAWLYALPYHVYEKYKVRKYGFHGTSHSFVSKRAAEVLGVPCESLKTVVCHLGNGSSISAVLHGKSVDTSMGLTPLEGLIMGTRSGDLDVGVLQFLMHKEHADIDRMLTMLNKESGIYGISGVSSDFRDVEVAAHKGDERAQMALDTFVYHVAKYIGSYAAAMKGIDAVVFTAGVGENDAAVRRDVCDYLGFLGIQLDEEANAKGGEGIISTKDSKVKVLVIPTNEELAIARETAEIVNNQ